MNDKPSPSRDFIGYADRPPSVVWPDEARVAINFCINYEEGGELCISLTRRLSMSHSANACLFAARHQNAALVILKQVLITQLRADTCWPNLLIIKEKGASDKRHLSVAALANGTTITCELRLDLTLIRSPECDILSRRVN
jgi:hypothetical protein